MDMLLIGANCVTEVEEKTQMAIWSISAAPLIMGNDLRNVSETSKAILLNQDAIDVNQDPLGQMGMRISRGDGSTEVWARNLHNGDVAVALYNTGAAAPVLPPFHNSTAECSAADVWTETKGGYYEACDGASGDLGQFTGLTPKEAQEACCSNAKCAGFSYQNGMGFYKENANCGMTKDSAYSGYTRTAAIPLPDSSSSDIKVSFDDPSINLFSEVEVYDIWEQKSLGTFQGSFTAKSVPAHGTSFLRLSEKK
jgi:hypothetical protein